MLLIQIPDIKKIIHQVGVREFYKQLLAYLKEDFSQWETFQKSPRHAVQFPHGVLELMPISSPSRYTFKYVNGHPQNPKQNKLNVVAFGALVDVATGYPQMISEMTLLTAFRTAATSAFASSYLARANSRQLAIIGCGAQSEFQVLAHAAIFDLQKVYYYDIDPAAMQKFARNLQGQSFELIAGKSAKEVTERADIIITATAAPGKVKVIEYAWLKPGQHISGIGGDSPGKTELDVEILRHTKTVVEYFPQTLHEGEIQNLGESAANHVHAELWQVVTGARSGRAKEEEITLFESVGFALEDYSTLRLIYDLAKMHHIGQPVDMIPDQLADCKNLYGLLID